MDLAHKGAMFDQLRRVGPYSLELSRFYAAELVSAIEHMHGLGIVHRGERTRNMLCFTLCVSQTQAVQQVCA